MRLKISLLYRVPLLSVSYLVKIASMACLSCSSVGFPLICKIYIYVNNKSASNDIIIYHHNHFIQFIYLLQPCFYLSLDSPLLSLTPVPVFRSLPSLFFFSLHPFLFIYSTNLSLTILIIPYYYLYPITPFTFLSVFTLQSSTSNMANMIFEAMPFHRREGQNGKDGDRVEVGGKIGWVKMREVKLYAKNKNH